MFSLIITIIAIALVAILAIAVIYYGGNSMQKGPAMAAAATLINQSTQIAAAGALTTADGGNWPTGTLTFPTNYLQSMPMPPRSAYLPGVVPAVSDWEYYNPAASSHHFVLRNKINKDACLAVNQKIGFNGIPAAWDGTSIIQCFGTGDNGAYTFFYDPPQSDAQNQAALDESLDQGHTTTPGYPRLCADGTTIATGVCPAADGTVTTPSTPTTPTTPTDPTTPTEPADTTVYHVVALPGVLTTDGNTQYEDNYLVYCAFDAPAGTFDTGSLLKVNGVQLVISDQRDFCVDVEQGTPALAAGSYSIEMTSTRGKRATGVIQYVTELAPAPEISDENAFEFPYKVTTTTTLFGSGFTPQSVVTDGVKVLASTFVNSTQLTVQIPPAKDLGFTPKILIEGDSWSAPNYFYVQNPNSGMSDIFNINYLGTDAQPVVSLTSDTETLLMTDFIIQSGGSVGGLGNNSHGVVVVTNNSTGPLTLHATNLLNPSAADYRDKGVHFELTEDTCHSAQLKVGDSCRLVVHYIGKHYDNGDHNNLENFVTLGPDPGYDSNVFSANRHSVEVWMNGTLEDGTTADIQVTTLQGDTLGVAWIGSVKYAGAHADGPLALCDSAVTWTDQGYHCFGREGSDQGILQWVLMDYSSNVVSLPQNFAPPDGWWTP